MRVARLENKSATLKVKPRNESASAFFDALVEAVKLVIGQQGQDRNSKKVLVGNVLLETEVIYLRNEYHPQYHSHRFTNQSVDNLYKFLEKTNIDFRTVFKREVHKQWLNEPIPSYADAFEQIFEATYDLSDSIR